MMPRFRRRARWAGRRSGTVRGPFRSPWVNGLPTNTPLQSAAELTHDSQVSLESRVLESSPEPLHATLQRGPGRAQIACGLGQRRGLQPLGQVPQWLGQPSDDCGQVACQVDAFCVIALWHPAQLSKVVQGAGRAAPLLCRRLPKDHADSALDHAGDKRIEVAPRRVAPVQALKESNDQLLLEVLTFLRGETCAAHKPPRFPAYEVASETIMNDLVVVPHWNAPLGRGGAGMGNDDWRGKAARPQ